MRRQHLHVFLLIVSSLIALLASSLLLVASGARRATAATVPAADGISEPDGSLWTLAGSWPAIAGLASPTIGWAPHPGGGAWEVAGDGGVFALGGAPFFGSTGGVHLTQPIVGMASTPDGGGYWLVASDGGVFAFGDARFSGSTGGIHLTQPIVGMASTSDGHGYWLVASDGGVFAFGDARFSGSTGGVTLARPVVGMASTPDGGGYWLVASDGGIFPFGTAGFSGSASGRSPAPAVSVTASGAGYDVVMADGSVWSFRSGVAPASSALPVPPSELASLREGQEATQAVNIALAQVGKPYVYGAAGPGSYDCSGLAQYSYASAGIPLARTAAEQYATTPRVPTNDLQPGDLLFFGADLSHVGIDVGNGEMVDAPHPGTAVRVESYQYFGPLVGASRPTLGH